MQLAGSRAFALGALPCLLLGLLVVAWAAATPGPIPLSTGPATPENLAARAAMLRERLPERFTVLVEPPFVLVLEESPEEAARHAATIRAAIAAMVEALFDRPPAHALDVWAFADAPSYRANTRLYLRDWPRTLHGYYAPSRRAVVLNLEGGDRAILHEIVHPFVEQACPDAPAWLDEGLASLFEPDDPARLDALLRALARRELPSLAALTVISERELYAAPDGMPYVQARSLLAYLRERGLLRRYVHALCTVAPEAARGDAWRGFDVLVALTRGDGVDDVQASWERFVRAHAREGGATSR